MEKLIAVDVDGVLNRLSMRPRAPEGWEWHEIGAEGELTAVLSPSHGPALLKLAADTGAQLAWATLWGHDANFEIAPRLGLPDLPVIPVEPPDGVRMEVARAKAMSVAAYAAGRPVVWFDDEPAAGWWLARVRSGPGLVVRVPPRLGLGERHIATARRWLSQW